MDEIERAKSKKTDSETQSLRSLKSEYDYGNKKKFVDVLGAVRSPDLVEAKLKQQID